LLLDKGSEYQEEWLPRRIAGQLFFLCVIMVQLERSLLVN